VAELLLGIGQKLGEKWLASLVVPGLLYVAAVVAAYVLGWNHAVDISMLMARISAWSNNAAARSAGGVVVVAAIALLSGMGAALAAEALGTAIAQCWIAEHWPRWPAPVRAVARRMVDARASRWDKASRDYRAEVDRIGRNQALAAAEIEKEQPYDLADLYYPVARLSRDRPVRPTWMGDRICAVTAALRTRYGLDLATVWPALSLTMPAEASAAIDDARLAYRRASVLAGWALLYLAVGIAWWPALGIAVVAAGIAVYRARMAVEGYSLLAEAAVVLYTPDLLRALGITHTGELNDRAGNAITRYLQGGA
jgi:hypothetical protein